MSVLYSPVKQSTIPSSGGGTAVPEYEELSDIHQRGVELKTSAHYETSESGIRVEYEELEPPLPPRVQWTLFVDTIAIITGICYKSHVDTIT